MFYAIDSYASRMGTAAGLPIVIHIPEEHNAPPSLMEVYVNGLRVDGPGGLVTLVTEQRNRVEPYLTPEQQMKLYHYGDPDITVTPEAAFEINATGEITGYDMEGGADVVIPWEIGGVPVTGIGEFAFSGTATGVASDAITSVIAPKSVTSIRDFAFSDCSILVSVSFPSATTIGDSVFSGCSILVNVSFPKVTTIGGYAFYGCSSLVSISFPSATTIGDGVFIGCSSLVSVYFGGDAPTLGSSVFTGTSTTIHVPVNAEGYGAFLGDRPVVYDVYDLIEEATPPSGALVPITVVTKIRIAPDAVTEDKAIASIYYSNIQGA